MKRTIVPLLILLLAFSVSLLSANKGDAKAGKAVYQKRCGTCHELSGAPKAAIAKMMKVEMRDLSVKTVQDKSDAELRKIVVEGTGKMKGVAGLSDKDMANLLAFVRSLAKK